MCNKENNKKVQDNLEAVGLGVSDKADFIISENIFKDRHLVGTINDQPFLLDYKDIKLIESYGPEVSAYYKDQTTPYQLDQKLYQLEKGLVAKGLIRINKSQIINIRHIQEIIPHVGQKFLLELKNKQEVYVNRSYYKSFKDYLNL